MTTTLAVGEILSTEQAGAYLHTAPATMRYWRSMKPPTGPPFVRLAGGKRVLYRRSDLDDWISAQVFDPAASA
jgi:predicted DNA-binding transcriptional regulator AlpA